ncbi:hypothetical protein ACFVTP_06585 [Streptomyces celluloflavus]|uniref:hypothetical protein n=1 Tax=Streptomyces celluloflavus TaxID=58344 RepID=UPI0036DAC043
MSATHDPTPYPEPEATPASEAPIAPAPAAATSPASAPAPPAARPAPRSAALVFDDPLNQQSSDDTDHGWGERPTGATADSAADLARFLDEKPPHHL